MSNHDNLRGQPTEYGGYGCDRDNSRTPTGRPVPKSTADLARDMRRAGLREAHGLPPEPRRKERGER